MRRASSFILGPNRRGIAGELKVKLILGPRELRTCRRAKVKLILGTKKEDLPESQFACILETKKEDLPEGFPKRPKGGPTAQNLLLSRSYILALVIGNVAISSCLARRLPAKPYYHPLIREVRGVDHAKPKLFLKPYKPPLIGGVGGG